MREIAHSIPSSANLVAHFFYFKFRFLRNPPDPSHAALLASQTGRGLNACFQSFTRPNTKHHILTLGTAPPAAQRDRPPRRRPTETTGLRPSPPPSAPSPKLDPNKFQVCRTMSTKIRVVVSSFGRPVVESFPAYTRKVGLPESRVLYTVLRSPHIDKKSREQFEMRIQKHVLDIKAERHELHHKLFWLKRHRMLGAQFEVQVSCKTRLDPKLLPLPQNHLHTGNLEETADSESQHKSS